MSHTETKLISRWGISVDAFLLGKGSRTEAPGLWVPPQGSSQGLKAAGLKFEMDAPAQKLVTMRMRPR